MLPSLAIAIAIVASPPDRGSRAPAFHAQDQFSQKRDLRSLCGSNGLVLLFVRSADW